MATLILSMQDGRSKQKTGGWRKRGTSQGASHRIYHQPIFAEYDYKASLGFLFLPSRRAGMCRRPLLSCPPRAGASSSGATRAPITPLETGLLQRVVVHGNSCIRRWNCAVRLATRGLNPLPSARLPGD